MRRASEATHTHLGAASGAGWTAVHARRVCSALRCECGTRVRHATSAPDARSACHLPAPGAAEQRTTAEATSPPGRRQCGAQADHARATRSTCRPFWVRRDRGCLVKAHARSKVTTPLRNGRGTCQRVHGRAANARPPAPSAKASRGAVGRAPGGARHTPPRRRFTPAPPVQGAYGRAASPRASCGVSRCPACCAVLHDHLAPRLLCSTHDAKLGGARHQAGPALQRAARHGFGRSRGVLAAVRRGPAARAPLVAAARTGGPPRGNRPPPAKHPLAASAQPHGADVRAAVVQTPQLRGTAGRADARAPGVRVGVRTAALQPCRLATPWRAPTECVHPAAPPLLVASRGRPPPSDAPTAAGVGSWTTTSSTATLMSSDSAAATRGRCRALRGCSLLPRRKSVSPPRSLVTRVLRVSQPSTTPGSPTSPRLQLPHS